VVLLLLSLVSGWGFSFPLSNSGSVDSRFFFQPDEHRFIYTMIEDDLTVVIYGPFNFGAGASIEMYTGTDGFRGTHWGLHGIFGVDYKDLFFNLFAGHERYQDSGDPDSSSQYITDLKLRFGNRPDIRLEDSTLFFPAGYLPGYTVNLGIYRPGGISFQKGHILDWSVHGELDYPVLSAHSMVYGISWQSDFYFHLDGGQSSRHAGEIYANRNLGRFDLALFLRRYLRDTQPIKPLEGETCFGLSFSW
jgi:hypothetical protein